ncbi:MAG TPA: SpoIVB peptidase [Thermaerobacter sp.]
MRDTRARSVGALVLASLLLLSALGSRFQVAVPDRVRLAPDATRQLGPGLPLPVAVRAHPPGIVRVGGEPAGRHGVATRLPLAVEAEQSGVATLDLSLFGWVPIRQVTVEVVPRVQVIPGGQSVGVMLQSRGVLVVDYAPVPAGDGSSVIPAREAGIRPGDIIQRINGTPVENDLTAARLIDAAGRAGRAVELELIRDGRVVRRTLDPVFNRDQQRYTIGVWVRDSVAGVGTLTFYDPRTQRYAALGHVVTDVETQAPLPAGGGEILPARITAIEPSRRGDPGEKIGVVAPGASPLGTIDRNTPVGISGKLLRQPPPGPESRPVPAALAGEVRPGPARIITVVEGEEPRAFDIEIERINPSGGADGKDMVIRVTDPELLALAGGIVQGMSGSPILQDGRLVGAVTHVFVNDATRGYGVFIERMLEAAGLMPGRPPQQASAGPGSLTGVPARWRVGQGAPMAGTEGAVPGAAGVFCRRNGGVMSESVDRFVRDFGRSWQNRLRTYVAGNAGS